MIDDAGVSELMGYTVLVAVVSIASVALLAGSMGTLSASEKQLEFQGSAASLRSFGDLMAGIIESNNTFDTAFEMAVPSGYVLAVRDRHDDFRSMSIYSNSAPLAYLPMGSVALDSPFRSVIFEGGAIISNDTGLVSSEISPCVRAAALPSGRKALYFTIVSISADTYIGHSGPETMYARCVSIKPLAFHVPAGSRAVIYVRSGDLPAWEEAFERCGLAVTYENGAVKASSTEVSDIYITYAEAEIHE
ncbi:conserved hypothetical protein [Methanocella paludicola SANAE]|uniref:Uncharacterized protein n=1 Tax=Methanocella paludicola (strain DSM 17711 / JCM 13418 / NBRC 101707 / SANAE) TaxID=304371 RepID=D1Z1R9_METPS|nr:hypothetical protein [Methanocella paludicola]BAI62641.1 conserved hypothetical protein [Methanocella paludicola SANAE]